MWRRTDLVAPDRRRWAAIAVEVPGGADMPEARAIRTPLRVAKANPFSPQQVTNSPEGPDLGDRTNRASTVNAV